jgi:3alpha(or 20beta)-hydroxysteroid dehydrogenase
MPRLAALISGAAMGMGASHAQTFVREGARVVLGDVAEEEGSSLAADLGENAAFVRLDVTDPDSWTSAVQFAEQTFGPIDVLVNNTGVAGPAAHCGRNMSWCSRLPSGPRMSRTICGGTSVG